MSGNLHFKYGKTQLDISVPEKLKIDTVQAKSLTPSMDGSECVRQAITEISPSKLDTSSNVVISINDKTRPVPNDVMLPPLLDYLQTNGYSRDQISFIVATGTHTPMPADEFSKILPENILSTFKVLSHNCDDSSNLQEIGVTSAGTKVLVNRLFYQAGLKIVVGNIEPHHFMGFSGGNKTASIGLTARSTINHNHSFLVSDLASTGNYESNPCRMDVEEIGRMIGVDLALNAILTTSKEIAYCLFGDPLAVMEKGIPLSREICQCGVDKKYDLVIASCGGYPKDISIYQAQKAITNAVAITRDQGDVVLFAECVEGPGSKPYMEFMQGVSNPDQALSKFTHAEFSIGPHKAFLLARQAKKVHLHLVSGMEADLVRSLFLNPVVNEDVERMLIDALQKDKTVAFMPNAVAAIPYIR